jgi:hypothetical protein
VRLPVVREDGSTSDFVAVDWLWVGDSIERVPGERLGANLGDQVALLGHDGLPASVEPGQEVQMVLYWQAVAPLDEDYTVFVHLIDQNGVAVSQHDGQPMQGFYPTSRWDVGDNVRDEFDVTVDESVPPGQYRWVAGMYLLSTGERLPLSDAGGHVEGDLVYLGDVTVIGD